MHTVLFVESGGSGGGSFLSLKLLVESLDRTRFRPVVAFLNETKFHGELLAAGIDARLVFDPVYSTSMPWRVRKYLERVSKVSHEKMPGLADALVRLVHQPVRRALRRIIDECGVELIYSNNHLNRNVFLTHLARDAGLPLVCHLRSRGNEHFVPARRDLVLSATRQFVCITEEVKKHWVESGIPAERVLVVPNCLPTIMPRPVDLNAEFGVPQGHETIGIVARMTWEKGHFLLLDAFAQLLTRRPDVTLLMVGDGPKEEELKEKAANLGIAEKVVFCGYQARAHDIIASLSLLVQPSKTDSASRSVLEAMQLGVPAVASRTGAIHAVMKDQETGFLVNEGDASELARTMETALADTRLRETVARKATAHVVENFDQKVTTGRIESILEQVLTDRVSGPGKG